MEQICKHKWMKLGEVDAEFDTVSKLAGFGWGLRLFGFDFPPASLPLTPPIF